MRKIKIFVDTREQKPYAFKGCITEPKVLKTGDYSVQGGNGRNGICIERKTLDDLFGTLTKKDNQKRFEDELKRMDKFGFKAVVIEGDVSDIVRGHKRSGANGRLILAYLLELCLKYQVCPLFCGNRAQAEQVTKDLLVKFAQEDVARRWWCR